MIERISENLFLKFKLNTIISKDDKSIYIYGIEILLINMFELVSALLIGILTGNVINIIFFLLSFITLRKFSGGYHASSFLMCFLLTNSAIIIATIIDFFVKFNLISICLIFFIMIFFCMFFAPIKNENKKINNELKSRCKYISILILLLQFFITMILFEYNIRYYNIITISVLFIFILMIFGKLKERR